MSKTALKLCLLAPLLAISDQFIQTPQDNGYYTSELDEQLKLLHHQFKDRDIGFYVDGKTGRIIGSNHGKIAQLPSRSGPMHSARPSSQKMSKKQQPKKKPYVGMGSENVPFTMEIEKIKLW